MVEEDVVSQDKQWWITLVLSFLLGPLGADRFYLGYIGIGLIKLMTFGGCLVWAAIDTALIIDNRLPDVNDKYPYKKQPSKEKIIEENISNKEWLTALLYTIFFGCLGIDRFYLGYKKFGLLKLIVFIITVILLEWSIICIIHNIRNLIIGSNIDASIYLLVVISIVFIILVFVLWIRDAILISLNKLPDKSGRRLWKSI